MPSNGHHKHPQYNSSKSCPEEGGIDDGGPFENAKGSPMSNKARSCRAICLTLGQCLVQSLEWSIVYMSCGCLCFKGSALPYFRSLQFAQIKPIRSCGTGA